MASNDPYPNDGYVWTTDRDGRQVRQVDAQCGYVLASIFLIFFLNFILCAVGVILYDDLSEVGPIFWSKLTPILYH